MRTLARTTLAALVLPLALAACGSDDSTQVASDDAPSASTGSTAPTAPTAPGAVPAAPGPVRSLNIPMVMDTGDGPELCLGAVAESYPPQCGGPEIVGWDWKAQAPNFDRQGQIRWGTFAVTGTWDGTTFTVTDAVPGALYDPGPMPPVQLPTPSVDLDQAERDAIVTELQDSLPGYQAAYADQEGHVLVDVTYDDGSLQSYVDEVYGAGVVVVSGALVDA